MGYFVDGDVKNTERVFPPQGRYEYHRYDMNENPEGLPAEFVESVLAEITPEFLATYPEPDVFTQKYADFIGVSIDNVLPTNGSDTAIRYILQVFCGRGHEVVTVSPSFEMYWVNCSILGLKHVPVPYNSDLTIDAQSIVNVISPNTDIVVLLNPNNPVGNVYTDDEVSRIISAAEENDAIVVIDEAYHYFYDKTFLDYAVTKPNVIVLRTFSKLFSLAACRLGVAISNPEIIGYLKQIKLSFDVNALALKFGERILDNRALVDELIEIERAGKAHLLKRLSDEGYEVSDCRGNYIFVKPRKNPLEVEEALRTEKKVLVKAWSGGLLKDYLRVSTGSVAAMDTFADAFLEVDA